MKDRIFRGKYAEGLVYADREREEGGDYKHLAFLSYRTLELEIRKDCPPELKAWIEHDAMRIQSMRGQPFRVSTAGQTVLLGG